MRTNRTPAEAEPGFTIGQLARAAGVNVETIRYYQRIKLVNEPPKPKQGYRRYPVSAADRIRFIKRAQELGFSLDEINDLLSLNDRDCDQARAIAEHKQELISQRIDDLSAMNDELTRLIKACRKNISRKDRCAIIATLTGNRRQ